MMNGSMDMMKNTMIGAIMNGAMQLKKNIFKYCVKLNLKMKNVKIMIIKMILKLMILLKNQKKNLLMNL
jgi:hypothetical protein